MTTQTSTPTSGQARRGYPPLSALRRSRTDRKLLGVCGGLGRWAGVDPLVFRVLFVVLTVFGGSGILLYAVGWLLVPEDGETESEAQRLVNGRSRSSLRTVIGIVVVLVVGIAATGWFIDSGPGFGGLGALVAVAAIVVLISRNNREAAPVTTATNPADQPPPPAEPGVYGQTLGTAYAASAPPSSYAPTAALPPPAGPAYPVYLPAPPPPPRERSILGRATLSVALIMVGLLVGANVATGSDVPARVVIAAALAVVGLGLLVGAFVGRARGLVALGVLLTLLASAAAIADVSVRGGAGDRTWRPATVSDLRDTYRLGIGEAELDLSGLDLTTEGRTRVEVRQGVGDLLVTVPADVVVRVDSDVNAGEIQLPDRPTVDGTDLAERTVLPEGSSPSSVVLVVDAQLGVGSLEVRRATS